MDSRRAHDVILFLRRACASADDRAGMTHPAARRRGLSGDKADYRLAHLSANEFRGLLLGISANFADHDDGVGIGVIVEKPNGIEERSANDGVATDADARGLADSEMRELADRLVSQCAAAAHHAHVAFAVNLSRHDADFAFAR